MIILFKGINRNKRINWKKYASILENLNIDNQYENTTDINEKVQLLTEQMLKASNEASFSLKIHKKPYILPEFIIDMIKEKRKYKREFMKSRDPLTKTKINRLGKQVEDQIAKFKRDSWNELCTKAKKEHISSSILWRKIKSINTTSNISTKNHKINLSNISNPTSQNIANEFAKMLENTFNLDINEFNYCKEALNNNNNTFQDKIMKIPDITSKEFEKEVKKLKTKSATGPDNIQYNHIKNAPKSFKNLIIKLFNTSLTSGEVPNSWEKSKSNYDT